jgi:hypothetical protein
MEIAKIVNNQPLRVKVERVDPPLRKDMDVSLVGGIMARYTFGGSTGSSKPVMVKVIERGKGGIRKCMVRVGGGWKDFELFLLDLQSSF